MNIHLFDKFKGDYIADELPLSIKHENNQLILDVPLLDAQGIKYSKVLKPISKNMFALTLDGTEMTFNFVSSDNGQSFNYLVNRNIVASRVQNTALDTHF